MQPAGSCGKKARDWRVSVKIAFRTHRGLVREKNQDFLFYGTNGLGTYAIVADGMGGHLGGEHASKMAVTKLAKKLDSSEIIQVKTWIQEINKELYDYSLKKPKLRGMGTTLTMALINNSILYLGHVGDSRAYLLRNNELCQLTTDHSFVQELINIGDITEEEANNHPRKNILTQAVGTSEALNIQMIRQEIYDRDILLLCSDGLTNLVNNNEISIALQNMNLEIASDHLLSLALDRGGTDNISFIIINYEKEVN